ncbi:Branched-chain amino acid transport system / permease component [Acididesulfobacillus acetoxydans]|uniref:Branched-chain amino acid transport system / permease component n=1 Tax=Acididesulfobacillus acetoxydans TaxID=1561005 RepID=A0A8S0W2P3_9FIRM|nr:ABC transporter permease [Acididesulfobacillus acetoxydans]CAA7600848.1 Branched-chain amino acid transport system / permease component [Acididesulfobacillus acetoxydans]CEJ06508.1 Branched-chain amino acid transport system / permease component protein [Acididesulfobacillus acetoxydans]
MGVGIKSRIATLRLREQFKKYNLAILLIVFIIVASSLSNKFFTISNLFNIIQQSSVVGIITLGMTYVILVAGIDLSVGSTAAFSGMVSTILISQHLPVIMSIVVAIFAGAIIGLINGWFSSYGGLPSFIVTLATMVAVRGATFILTNGTPIYGLSSGFTFIGTGTIGQFPISGAIWIIITLVLLIISKYTGYGRNLYAVGGNPEASYLSGIKVNFVVLIAFTISGILSAFAGILLASWLTVGQPTAATGVELNAIAAVVLGGTSLFGGKGGILGSFIGVLLMAVITNIFNLVGLGSYYQSVFMGVIIVGALMMNKYLVGEKS